MHLYPLNGAAQRVGKTDTAYSFREALFAEAIVGVDPDPANADKITTWCKEYWDALHPFSAGGAYVNFMMDEGHDRIQAAFRDNYGRLATIKKKYDPTNFFRVNQNIRPASFFQRRVCWLWRSILARCCPAHWTRRVRGSQNNDALMRRFLGQGECIKATGNQIDHGSRNSDPQSINKIGVRSEDDGATSCRSPIRNCVATVGP